MIGRISRAYERGRADRLASRDIARPRPGERCRLYYLLGWHEAQRHLRAGFLQLRLPFAEPDHGGASA